MSCLGFMTPGQRAALRASSADGEPLSSFRSPEPSAGKVERVRQLAASADPKIRESAALSYLAPTEVLAALAGDAETGVRCCVARNPRTPVDVLERLAGDESAGVRGWVATNPTAPAALLEALAQDASDTVREVATWAMRWPQAGT